MERISFGYDERWRGACTLAQTVYKLVIEKKTESPEFKSLLAYYGREKMVALYQQALDESKGRL